MRARINVPSRQQTIIRRNAGLQATGNLDAVGVAERGMRAVKVIRGYSIYSNGSNKNGWGEVVEAYDVHTPSGKQYVVQMRRDGQGSCDCMDWKTRRHIHAGLCKHVIAVKALREGKA